MDDLLKDINVPDKEPKSVQKTPNTEQDSYGKDSQDIKMGVAGDDPFTKHIIQDVDWTDIPISYKWNSFGLRGPEPDLTADTRILFAGGSTTLGVGVPVENTYPYIVANKLNASYVNLSDVDSLEELVDLLPHAKQFEPHIVVISDTRFVQYYAWALSDIYRSKEIERKASYKNIFKKSDERYIKTFDGYIKSLFPESKIIFARCVRRAFLNIPELHHMQDVRFEKEHVVDLARDNKHPGPKSHELFAEEILKCI